MHEYASLLRFCPLFKTYDEAHISDLLSVAQPRVLKRKAGEVVASMGQPCDELNILVRGVVFGEMVDNLGRCLKIEEIRPPTPIAIAFIFGSNPLYPVNVVAKSDVELLVFPKETLINLIRSEERFLFAFLNLVSNKVQFMTEKVQFFSFTTVKQKLASYLLTKSSESGVLTFPGSQEVMADFFGITRPSFARVLKEFKDSGLIDVNRRSVRILNRETLLDYLNQ